MEEIKFTIIIPHKNTYKTLIRLLNIIPNDPELEVIIVDDNSENATKEKLKKTNYNENVKIIYDNSSGGAGKARNIGLDNVNGNCKWLLFADADDYFTTDFYELINQYYDDLSDIVYFGAHSVHGENLQKPAQRHIKYMGAIREYLKTPANQDILKYGFRVPWAKIIRRELIEHNNIRFEEVVITNDDFFSLKAGHYAKTLTATLDTIYIVTYAKNNLSSSFTSDKVRYNVKLNVRLRANKFLRSIGKGKYQTSFHFILLASFNFGIKHFFYTIFQFVKYRQNPFIKINGIAKRHLKEFSYRIKYKNKNFIIKNKNFRIILFIHIPKTAGKSITSVLFDRESANHKKANEYNIFIYFSYTFCFVRNPFDRFYSVYMYFLKGGNLSHITSDINIQKEIKKYENFSNFIKKFDQFKYKDYLHFLPQYLFIYKKNKCLVDYIGRFENLENDFEPIRKKYGLEKLPHLNKSQECKNEWKDHYTKELADLVYNLYKKDFELWYPDAYKELIDHIEKKKK